MSFSTRALNLFLANPLWVVMAVAAAIVIGMSIRTAVVKTRKAPVAQEHAVLTWCAAHGHAYAIHDTGWRCGACGNHAPRREGERYGRREEGFVDRRRHDRLAA